MMRYVGKRMQFQHEGKADEIHNNIVLLIIVTMGTVYTVKVYLVNVQQ